MRLFFKFVLITFTLHAAGQQVIWVSRASDRGQPFETDELVWTSTSGCIGEEDDCTAVHAEAIAEDLRESVNAIGEELGIRRSTPNGSEYRLVRAIVVPPPPDEEERVAEGRYGKYHGGDRRTIVLPEHWPDSEGVVHHEAAHDFFKEHMGDIVRDPENQETRALNEGIA